MRAQSSFRYWVRSPDGRAIFGFDRLEAATTAALEMPLGAHLVDTLAQAYFPVLQEVQAAPTAAGAGGGGGTTGSGETAGRGEDMCRALVYLPFGGWDNGRFGLDHDLIEGIKKGHVAIAHAYLAKGASANARDARGGTALHWAVGGGRAEIVALLLRAGADPAALDGAGQTAADVARRKGRVALAEMIEGAR